MRRSHRCLLAALLALSSACKAGPSASTEAPEQTPPLPSATPLPSRPVAPEAVISEPRNAPAEQPRGNAGIGALQTAGGEIDNAARVVASMRSEFRNCYNRGLNGLPDFHATLRLTVLVGPAGEVTDVAVVGKLPAAAEKVVRPCIEERVRAAQFNPPHGNDGRATLTFPATFVLRGPPGYERSVF